MFAGEDVHLLERDRHRCPVFSAFAAGHAHCAETTAYLLKSITKPGLPKHENVASQASSMKIHAQLAANN